MAYKACFACELLFEVDPGLGESTRCPQCGGVLSDYDPSADELTGRARDVAPAPTEANQAIVRTMSYKGLADAVKAQIGSQGAAPAARPQPRGRPAPMPRGRASGPSPAVRAPAPRAPTRGQVPARPRTGGLIPARPTPQHADPGTDEYRSASEGEARKRPSTAPIASLNTSAAELFGEAPAPARPVPVAAAPVIPAAPPAEGKRGTKVLDAVDPDDDVTSLDAAGAAVLSRLPSAAAAAPVVHEESVIEDISMQSMQDDSLLEDISMQSVSEAAPGGYELPATVALVQDPARPLPPIGGAPAPATPKAVPHVDPLGHTEAQPAPDLPPIQARPRPVMPQPAMPQPVVPQPVMPQPAMPQAMPQPVMPQAMPQPAMPQPASPFGVAPAPSVGAPIGAPDPEHSTGASAFAPVDFDHGAARKKSGPPLALIIVLVLLVLGGVGAAVWFLVIAEPEPEVAEAPVEAPVELTWSEKIAAQVEAGQGALPTVTDAAPLVETTWIAGGPEGMSTSLGLVTGMATSVIREGAAQDDESGSWVPAVQKKLAEGNPGADAVLLLGFPGDMSAADFLRFADAGRRAGHGAFAMIVGLEDQQGALAQLPFTIAPKGSPLPETGAIKVGIGTLGLHVTARDGQDKRLPEGQAEGEDMPEPRVPMKNGGLDIEGFGQRLAALKDAQPGIERVIVRPAPATKAADLARLLHAVYKGTPGKKFAEIALVP